MRRMIHVSPDTPSLRPNRARSEVNPHSLHTRKIYDQAPIAYSQPSTVVSSAAHGRQHSRLAAVMNGGDDIGDINAFGNQGGAFVDHPVVYLARGIVSGVA